MAKQAGSEAGDSGGSSYIGFSVKERRIYIRGFVDDDTSLHFADGFDQMRGKDPIVIDITSGGGEIRAALDIYNRIRNSEGPVIIVTFGGVASASMIIFLAADERLAAADCLLRFHWNVSYRVSGTEESPDNFKDNSDFSEKMFALMNKIISDRTIISVETAAEYGRHMTAFTGAEAKQLNIVTAVFDGKKPLIEVGKEVSEKIKKVKKGHK